MNRPYLIESNGQPVVIAMTQASAMNAMFQEAAEYMTSFLDEREFNASMMEDADHNLKLRLEVTGSDTRTWTGKVMAVYMNEHYDKALTPNDAIQHYIDFLDN